MTPESVPPTRRAGVRVVSCVEVQQQQQQRDAAKMRILNRVKGFLGESSKKQKQRECCDYG